MLLKHSYIKIRTLVLLLFAQISCSNNEKLKTDLNTVDYKKTLKQIWDNNSFNTGNRCFWYGNIGLFRILDKNEFEEMNLYAQKYDIEKFYSKKIIAVSDFNADREPISILYLDPKNSKIYYFMYLKIMNPNSEFIRVSKDFEKTFYSSDIFNLLISKKDWDVLNWCEENYHSYIIKNEVPRGIFPKVDLRNYVKSLKGTYVSDFKEFNLDLFKEYFSNYNLSYKIPDDFYTFTVDEKLKKLINEINLETNDNNFEIIYFNPSSYWGIFNKKELKKSDLIEIKQLGLVRK